MIHVQRIDRQHPLYEQERDLRERVLLGPIGLTFDAFEGLFPGFEDRFLHFVAVFAHPKGPRVVGCALLLPDYPQPGVGKLMQMAVDPQRQHEGLGSRLVAALEQHAFTHLGISELFCHSQEAAKRFYEKLGWTAEGERFTEAGIPHFKMVFRP
ncbi:MAG: GNAT family N-acetyltransferase [Phycisphaerales bacterium]|nr:GNAT family N-acetyltransferase [Phycisphaerales bacterium]